MNKLKQKFAAFMTGRYGMDELAQAESRLTLVLAIVFIVCSFFSGRSPILALLTFFLNFVWIGLIVHLYYRVFSRNISKRYAENQKFRNFRYRQAVKRDRYKKEWDQRAVSRFFSCPQCHQRVRVPKGRGKICITCPKCRTEFTRRS